MDWDDLHYFNVWASAGSLAAAARVLGVEHATVARRIASLEAQLAAAIVDRRGRRWLLTAEGKRIAVIADRMEMEARAVERSVEGGRKELSGTITISAPPALAAEVLTGALIPLQKANPRLSIRMVGEARTASLNRGEADIALRLTRPEDGELTMSKVGKIQFRLYASPGYVLDTRSENWRFIGYDGASPAPQQTALEKFANGRTFSFYASSLEIQQAAARAGGGIAALPDFMAASDGQLVRVGPDLGLISRDIWLVVHTEMKRSAPVKEISETLRATLAKRFKSR